MKEAHCSRFSVHLGTTKMYRDLKQRFWWSGMKEDVAKHVELCHVCQQVKAEHQRQTGTSQSLPIPFWK